MQEAAWLRPDRRALSGFADAELVFSSPLATKVALLIVRSLATTLKPIILKLLASSAFKAAVLAKIKAVVVGSVIGVLVHMLAAKFGLSAGAAFAWILLPLLAAWIAREIWKFPEKLASKVSEAVANDLGGNFARTSRDLAERLVQMILVEGEALNRHFCEAEPGL